MRIKFPKNTDQSNPYFEFFYQVSQHPLLDGMLVEDVEIGASATAKIKHRLGRPARGYIVTARDSPATFVVNSNNTRPETEIWLTNTQPSAVTASFWIF